MTKKTTRVAQRRPKGRQVSPVASGPSKLWSKGGWTLDSDADMDAFVKSVRFLASSEPKLREKYAGLWVAIRNGKVAAHARDISALMAELGQRDIKRDNVLIHKIVKQPRALVV
jgi:hypothetical protein